MTLASDNRVTAEYTADGTQVQFTYDFPIFFSDESRGIQVRFVDGTSFEIVDTGEYIVVQNTENTGGYIQFSTAPTSGKIVQIVGKTPVDQQLEIANQSRFDPESIETNFDKIVAILQEWLQQLSDEEKLRIANDLALTNRIDATDKNLASEIANRISADQNLQNQITSNTISINDLKNIVSESINNGTSPNLAVFAVSKKDDLSGLKTWDGRTVYVRGDGEYYYSNSQNVWIKDEPYNVYNFKNEQPIQYYYNKLGNWDDAIFEAQVNVYKLGYSTKLVLPHGVIEVTRPILFNDALYYRIDKLYPELGVYDKVRNKFGNSIDDNYFTTSWCLTGAGKSSQPAEGFNQNGNSGSIGGLTSIKFVGGSPISNSSTDKQYMNYGIIHCAPDFIDGRKPRDYYDKDYPSLSGFNAVEISNLNIEGNTRCIHGIVIFGGHFHKLSNITIHDCYGAGIFLNWCFDMNVNDVTFIHCGRMSPNFNDYIADNKFGVEYQTYAPMQITCSGVRYDNSNYIRLDRCHFENNFRVCADVIVGGDSTPIWITNAHHESGEPIINNQDTKRVCYVPSKYGVAYFGQDSESDFDYKNISYNLSGGIIISRDCYGYSTNFSHVAIIDQYGQLDISGFNLSASVKLSANNANALYRAKNCVINDLEVNGGFSNDLPLDLEDVRIHGNVTTNYLNNFRFERVVIDGNTAFNYTDLSYNNPRKSMDFVSFGGSVNGDIRGGVLTNLKFNTANYNLINSGGITAEASNITNLEDYLKS